MDVSTVRDSFGKYSCAVIGVHTEEHAEVPRGPMLAEARNRKLSRLTEG